MIVVYLEGVRNTKVFREACKAARAAGKPVIALKLGASEGGRAAAMAHTGALAGSIETFDAISTREGVIRVRGLDELIETTECFVHADAAEEQSARRGLAVRRQARPADRRVLFGRPELCAAQPERAPRNWQRCSAPAASSAIRSTPALPRWSIPPST